MSEAIRLSVCESTGRTTCVAADGPGPAPDGSRVSLRVSEKYDESGEDTIRLDDDAPL